MTIDIATQDNKTVEVVKFSYTKPNLQKVIDSCRNFELVPDNKKSFKELQSKITICVSARTSIEKQRLDINRETRAETEDRITLTNNMAAELQAIIEPVETQLKNIKEAESNRVAEAYKELTDKAEDYIFDIKLEGESLEEHSIEELNVRLEELDGCVVDPAVFEGLKSEDELEYIRQANDAFTEARQTILTKIQRMELEAQKAEQDARQLELDYNEAHQINDQLRIDAGNKHIANEKAKLEADKKAEEDRKAREKREADIREEERVKAEAEAKEKVERDRIAKEEQIKKDAEEKARQEALKPEKERCLAYLDELKDVEMPVISDEKLLKQLDRIITGLGNVYKSIQEVG